MEEGEAQLKELYGERREKEIARDAVATEFRTVQDDIRSMQTDIQDSQKGLAAGELAARLALPAPTLSFHLKELTHAELIAPERNGRSIVYRAQLESVRLLINFMMEDCCSEC